MAHKKSFGLTIALLFLASLGAPLSGSAMTPGFHSSDKRESAGVSTSRLAGDWRNSQAVTLPGSKPSPPPFDPPLDFSRTPAPSNARLSRILLLLAPSPTQQEALTTELTNLQNPTSPEYHHWLTPASFADKYSNSAADVSAVSAWLQSQGFQVAALPASRGWIEFSGTVAQVEQAFQTRVDSVSTPSGSRFVLSESISVPSALAPTIQGLVSLDGVIATAALTQPQWVNELESVSTAQMSHGLTPQLVAELLHFDTLHASGITGTGETIVIASRSNINRSDVAAFRAAFGLSASEVGVLPNGDDPGLTADQAESTLAVSWAGAAAPGAQILLVPASTTSATDGLDLSLAAIVDQAIAHTVSVGYSSCEAALSPAHQAFYAALYRQAAAEGISIVAATGDSGPSACHLAGSATPVLSGYGVNALASTPWNTAVGVAGFTVAGPQGDGSAMLAWSPTGTTEPGYASGGGSSTLYTAPLRQPIPSKPERPVRATESHYRLLPDLSLPTAIDSISNPGLAFCLSAAEPSHGCTLMRAGGSSAAAAIFAGIAALVDQANGQQGNLAPNLYLLSRQTGIFSDVEQGAAKLPCVPASADCDADGQIGFSATTGYDFATGLGVVNAHNLVTDWDKPEAAGTGLANVTNTTSPGQTINPSGSIVLSASIVSGTGGPAPTGTVTFQDITLNQTVSTVALSIGTGETSAATVTVTGALAQGGHQIVADYSGDSTYAPANSGPVVVEVQPSSTTTTIVPSTTTPTGGATFSVSATITSLDAGAGALPPSGTVDFRMDGVSQGTQTVVTGSPSTATLNMTAPYSTGTHQIVGFYSGDNNYFNSTSQAATITVTQSAPTITLTPATASPLPGSSLLITANISPPDPGGTPPTGTVTFTLDGTTLSTQPVTSGTPSTATITITAPSSGGHTLKATYSGDSNYTSVTSSPVTITIAKTPTSLALLPATTTPMGGSSLLVTATLSVTGTSTATPTGIVTFVMDGATTGTGTLSASGTTATLSITVPASGSHTLQASYGGDTNFQSSTSPSVNFAVAKTPTTTVATPATTTPTAGNPLQVTATITPSTAGSTQPTGNVTFSLDGVSAGVESVTAGSPSTASITISTIPAGTHLLVATYSGDNFYAGSTSASVTITTGKSPTSTVVTPASLTPTAGASLAVSAAITSSSPSATNPTGTVSFAMDGVAQGTATVTSASPSTASFTIPLIAAGAHVLTAKYSGDTSYLTSTSAPVSVTATKGATTTTVTASPTILSAGTTETLSATVAPENALNGTGVITGTVSFYDNGTTLLGSATVASGGGANLIGISLANNVNHSITAVYSGDTNWLTSTSPALLLAATTLPDTVVLTSNFATVSPGQALILTATVTPTTPPVTGAEQNPTGSVVFYNGTTMIGTATLAAAPVGNSSTATFTTETLPGGQDVLSAVYQGDLYYDTEPSNLLTLDIEDFTIVPAPTNPATNLNIVQGASGSASFVITGLGGFTNSIQVVCAVPTQDDLTCTASPQEVAPPGNATFVIQTFTPGEQGSTTSASHKNPPMGLRAAGGAALAVLGFFLLPYGRRARIFAGRASKRIWIILPLLVGLGGAGIGCSSVTPAVNSTGTPLGVATLKITASANVDNTVVSHSVYLTVNVLAPGSSQ